VIFVLWAVATVTFFAIRLIPGDPAEAILGGPGSQASAAALARARADYGLDQPLFVQYLQYLGRMLRGDLGNSYALKQPVIAVVGENLGGTLLLAVVSLIVAAAIALALSAWSARGGRVASGVSWLLEVVAAAVPPGAVIRPHSPASARSIHLIANDGARRVPSLAATSRVLHGLDGNDWGLVTV